jgi:hypothetical protein
VAVRAARFSPEQRSALRMAYAAFWRNTAEPVRLWRQAVLQLVSDADAGPSDQGATPPPPVVAAEVLCDQIERSASHCLLHRALLTSRFFSIVRPRQLAGLLADSFPFVMRPVVILAPEILGCCEDCGGGGRGD